MPQLKKLDCACVIHGDLYHWTYVEHLYKMLERNLTVPFNFHVFTEERRPVPYPFIKHSLKEWPGIHGPRKSWWYKMQLFDPDCGLDKILYFDLDVVILKDLNWITSLDIDKFWTIKDFKYLWKPQWTALIQA